MARPIGKEAIERDSEKRLIWNLKKHKLCNAYDVSNLHHDSW